MITDLEITRGLHSYDRDKDGEPVKKYYLSVAGTYKGSRRQAFMGIMDTDSVIPWIEVLYKRLTEDFEKEEQTTPQESV